MLALAADAGRIRHRPRLVPDLPYLAAEALFAVRHEHALEVEDVLRRRVPLFRSDRDQGLGCAAAVADILAAELGWSPARREQSLAAYQEAVAASRRWRQEWPTDWRRR